MKKIRFLAAAFLLVPALSRAACKMGDCINELNSIAFVPVVGMHDMEGGHWMFQVAPSFSKGTFNVDSAGTGAGSTQSGLYSGSESVEFVGGSFAVKREISEHWGAAALGTFVDQSGTPTLSGNSGLTPVAANTGTHGGAGFDGGSLHGMYQNMVAIAFTHDHFTKDDWFRMPFSFGPAYFWEGFKFDHTFNNPGNSNLPQTESVNWNTNYAGFFGNISFDFTLWKAFEIDPGVVFYSKFHMGASTADYDYVVSQNGGPGVHYPWNYYYSAFGGTPYLTLLYKPWNLSFNYIVPLIGEMKMSTYSLTLSKKF
jgi:hypothetical protein